jgi:hypothetical protein
MGHSATIYIINVELSIYSIFMDMLFYYRAFLKSRYHPLHKQPPYYLWCFIETPSKKSVAAPPVKDAHGIVRYYIRSLLYILYTISMSSTWLFSSLSPQHCTVLNSILYISEQSARLRFFGKLVGKMLNCSSFPICRHLFTSAILRKKVHLKWECTMWGVFCNYKRLEMHKLSWDSTANFHYLKESATWYSTHKCSMILRFNCENGVFIYNFYFLWGQCMCGAPERLTAFGACTFLVLSQQ